MSAREHRSVAAVQHSLLEVVLHPADARPVDVHGPVGVRYVHLARPSSKPRHAGLDVGAGADAGADAHNHPGSCRPGARGGQTGRTAGAHDAAHGTGGTGNDHG